MSEDCARPLFLKEQHTNTGTYDSSRGVTTVHHRYTSGLRLLLCVACTRYVRGPQQDTSTIDGRQLSSQQRQRSLEMAQKMNHDLNFVLFSEDREMRRSSVPATTFNTSKRQEPNPIKPRLQLHITSERIPRQDIPERARGPCPAPGHHPRRGPYR